MCIYLEADVLDFSLLVGIESGLKHGKVCEVVFFMPGSWYLSNFNQVIFVDSSQDICVGDLLRFIETLHCLLIEFMIQVSIILDFAILAFSEELGLPFEKIGVQGHSFLLKIE